MISHTSTTNFNNVQYVLENLLRIFFIMRKIIHTTVWIRSKEPKYIKPELVGVVENSDNFKYVAVFMLVNFQNQMKQSSWPFGVNNFQNFLAFFYWFLSQIHVLKLNYSVPPKVSRGLQSKKNLKSGAARFTERNIVCTPHSKVSRWFKNNVT